MMNSTSSSKLMLKSLTDELDDDVLFVIFIVEFIVIAVLTFVSPEIEALVVVTGIVLQTRSLALVPGVEIYSLELHVVQFVHILPVNSFLD